MEAFTKDEVSKHTTKKTGIWVTYKDNVYNVTDFVDEHPGGVNNIMRAAGSAVDSIWPHKTNQTVLTKLESMLIGALIQTNSNGDEIINRDRYTKMIQIIYEMRAMFEGIRQGKTTMSVQFMKDSLNEDNQRITKQIEDMDENGDNFITFSELLNFYTVKNVKSTPPSLPAVLPVVTVVAGAPTGWDTYQLSLSLDASMANVYAIYGTETNPMSFPPAYQCTAPFGQNIGGTNPELWALANNAKVGYTIRFVDNSWRHQR